jgi:hypothetical protein
VKCREGKKKKKKKKIQQKKKKKKKATPEFVEKKKKLNQLWIKFDKEKTNMINFDACEFDTTEKKKRKK